MALSGALAENTRRNERIERGIVTVTGSSVVTVAGVNQNASMRQITHVLATIVANATPGLDPITVTVGNVGSGGNAANQFTIFLWKATSNANPTLIASTTATPVYWQAWGNLSAGAGF